MSFHDMYSVPQPGRGSSLTRTLCLAGGTVVIAVMLSLLLSGIAHIRLPVYAQLHLYGAIFVATRFGGLQSGIVAFVLAFLLAAFFSD